MKTIRILARIGVLSLAAAGFIELTALFGDAMKPAAPSAAWRTERRHRPSRPQASYILEFFGEGVVLAVFGVAGRVVFRLRLSPASRTKGQPILLDLQARSRLRNPQDAGTPGLGAEG